MTLTTHDLSLLREMKRAGLVYVSFAGEGPCKRCGFVEDLRMGSCFFCSQFICGKDHGDGFHELWDRQNPSNRWIVSVQP